MTVEEAAGQMPAQVMHDRWHAASHRCSCGLASDDASEFDRHLDTAEEAEQEHFEVLDGWTLQQVRQWQAAASTPDGARVTVRAMPGRLAP